MTKTSFVFQSYIAAIQQLVLYDTDVDSDSARKIGLMYGISVIGIVFLSMLGTIAIMQGGLLLATLDFLVALFLLGLIFLLRIKGYFRFCVYAGVTIMYWMFLYLFISGGIAGTAFLWSYTYPLFTFFLLGSQKGFWVSAIYFLSCIAVLIVDLNSSFINLYDMNLALRFAPSFAVVTLFSLLYEKYRESSQRALLESKNNLEIKVEERTAALLQEVQVRKKKEQELRTSEARYRALYDNSGDGICIVNREGYYKSVNRKLSDRVGYSEEEFKLRTPMDFYTGVPDGFIRSMLDKAFATGSAEYEAVLVTRSGEHIPVEIRAQRFIFDNEEALLCTCREITGRKKREEENRNLQERLHRASKMEAIGLMAGGIAHDLNNILAGVTGYPELLLLELSQDSKMRKPVEEVLHSGRRAAAVVAELLTMARGVASAKDPHDCNRMIEKFLNTLEAIKITEDYPGVEVVTQFGKATGRITCSPIHLQKCIMNLLLNAVEAVDDLTGARVEITTARKYLDEDIVERQHLESGDYVLIGVHDNGPGISSQDIEHIFEPFYSKKIMGRSGTGLGLTVVWNVVHEHDGAISVKSSGEGTTFTLYFPATDDAEIEPIDEFVRWPKPAGHILVVDDEQQLRDVASAMLATFGYTAKSVSSGEKAVAILQEEKFDMVLLDMLMEPGMNGRQTYEEIIKINPGQKALIASGFSENEEVKRALELGAGGFIKKPYSLNELWQAVQNAECQEQATE